MQTYREWRGLSSYCRRCMYDRVTDQHDQYDQQTSSTRRVTKYFFGVDNALRLGHWTPIPVEEGWEEHSVRCGSTLLRISYFNSGSTPPITTTSLYTNGSDGLDACELLPWSCDDAFIGSWISRARQVLMLYSSVWRKGVSCSSCGDAPFEYNLVVIGLITPWNSAKDVNRYIRRK